MPLQLPEGKRKIKLRSNEKSLHEEDRPEKDQDPSNQQGKAKAWPAFPGWIGKNKWRHRMGRILFHFANDTMPRDKM